MNLIIISTIFLEELEKEERFGAEVSLIGFQNIKEISTKSFRFRNNFINSSKLSVEKFYLLVDSVVARNVRS